MGSGLRCLSSRSSVPHVAVVGSGPGGFYSAQHILKKLGSEVRVDIFEKDPIPFGLVRYGVAPDHPEVKNVINTFTQVAENPYCNFYGNVEVGKDVLIKDLRRNYSAVVLAYGCSRDKDLNIPGEKLKNVLSAGSVINWYNGYPGCHDLEIDLGVESCVILGQGNVAVDVARILLSPLNLLQKTDISEHALSKLSESKIEKIFMVGRRGPLQAAFTAAEFRETINLPGCKPVLAKRDFVDLKLDEIPRPKKRLMGLQMKTALDESSEEDKERWTKANRELHYVYKRSPVRFLVHNEKPNRVGAVELGINELNNSSELNAKAIPTNETEVLEAGLVIKSIGFAGLKIEEDMIFDERTKIVPNERGRVVGSPGLYCSGWIKTGPVGVIASTMNGAFETGKAVVDDLQAGVLEESRDVVERRNGLLEKLKNKYVTFSNWKKLDQIEVERGLAMGKSRQKVLHRDEMLRLMSD